VHDHAGIDPRGCGPVEVPLSLRDEDSLGRGFWSAAKRIDSVGLGLA